MRAKGRTYGSNLDLDPNLFQIFWFGKRGMIWEDLMTEFVKLCYGWPLPHILVIHLGGNDVGKRKTLDLVFSMQCFIQKFKALSPGSVIVFSEIIPQLTWLQGNGNRVFEKIRKRINHMMEKFLTLGYGISFHHVQLEGGIPGLYREDGVHLSEIGLDILNLDFQTAIEMAAVWVV